MDQNSPKEQQVCVDILSVINNTDDQEGSLGTDSVENQVFPKSCDHFMSVEDDFVRSGVDPLNGSHENVKEKRKKGASSAKKPPKPPRPQRGFSLDAADQKLIKELTELAMIKRARIERMKALMQKKAASKASASSSSSLFAMIFTIFVFAVVLFQGMSCQISCGTYEGSPPSETNETGLIFIHEESHPSAHDSV